MAASHLLNSSWLGSLMAAFSKSGTTTRQEHDMALTKANLIDSVSFQSGFTKKQSTDIVETIIGSMKEALSTGEDVLISGFGKFCVRQKAERKGRNPDTGDDLILPARRVVTFKCSGKLRNRINGS